MHGLLEVVSNFFEPRFASKSPYSLLLHFVCMMNMEDDVVDLCFARAEKNCQPSKFTRNLVLYLSWKTLAFSPKPSRQSLCVWT